MGLKRKRLSVGRLGSGENGGIRGLYPQIPVLLMPTVTSPCLRSCPFFTLSSVGPDSATQSLCSGSVKTPILGKLIVSVTVAMVALF